MPKIEVSPESRRRSEEEDRLGAQLEAAAKREEAKRIEVSPSFNVCAHCTEWFIEHGSADRACADCGGRVLPPNEEARIDLSLRHEIKHALLALAAMRQWHEALTYAVASAMDRQGYDDFAADVAGMLQHVPDEMEMFIEHKLEAIHPPVVSQPGQPGSVRSRRPSGR